MVTSPHSLASAAGVDVLRAGGSVVDAAIATSAVLGVIYPHMTGLGGDAFWLINDAKQNKVRFLDGGGRASRHADLSALKTLMPAWFESAKSPAPALAPTVRSLSTSSVRAATSPTVNDKRNWVGAWLMGRLGRGCVPHRALS
jgi:gamma-glutamyltranspeptidase